MLSKGSTFCNAYFSFLCVVGGLNRPHGASLGSLYLLLLLLHLLFLFRGCQFGPGMNGRFPLFSVTPIILQLLFYPER